MVSSYISLACIEYTISNTGDWLIWAVCPLYHITKLLKLLNVLKNKNIFEINITSNNKISEKKKDPGKKEREKKNVKD